ncbi:MAG: polysaccharide deacetylase family protein [Desulfobacula sp.]|nr:polysaccharide deacetylase family protein [Desulfobacula sp.]
MIKHLNANIIFCYHRVIPKDTAKQELVHPALYVTPETFEQQVKWMMANGKISAMNNFPLEHDRKLKFWITFDDGWKDNIVYALPVLQKYGIPAHIFVSTSQVDTGSLFWSELIGIQIGQILSKRSKKSVSKIVSKLVCQIRSTYKLNINVSKDRKYTDLNYLLDRLIESLKLLKKSDRDIQIDALFRKLSAPVTIDERKYILTWDDLEKMTEAGMTVGSHTHRHILLNYADDNTIQEELMLSKCLIEKKLGIRVDTFAYPNGYFQNSELKNRLRQNGYKYAFKLGGIIFKNYDPLLIPRCVVSEDRAYNLSRYVYKLAIKTLIHQSRKILQ